MTGATPSGQPALVASQSSRQGVSTKGFDQAQFTPGPWFADENKYGEFAIVRDNGNVVALLDDTEAHGLWDEYRANACLIAAAPELFDALDELHLKAVVGTDEERHAALDRAWRALSKARGAA